MLHNTAAGLVTSGPVDLAGGTNYITGILPVPYGGTGVNTLNSRGVLIGQGTNPVTVTAAGTAGQVLQSRGSMADPSYSTAIYPTTTTINQLLYSSADNNITGLPTANMGYL